MPNKNDLILPLLSPRKKRTLRKIYRASAETMTVGDFLDGAARTPRNSDIQGIMKEVKDMESQDTQPNVTAPDLDLDFPAYRLLSPAIEKFSEKKKKLGEITVRELLSDKSAAKIRIEARELSAKYIENGGVINGYATEKGIVRIPYRALDDASLYSRLEELIKEAVKLSVNDKEATRLNYKYFEHKPLDIETWYAQSTIKKFIDKLRSGKIIEGYPWFTVDTSIFDELEALLNEYYGRRVADFEQAIGCPEGTLADSFLGVVINCFGFDVPKSRYAENHICKLNAAGATKKLYHILDKILSASVLPLSISELQTRVLEDKSAVESFANLEDEIRNWIANNPHAIITENDEVSYVGEALKLEEYRVARLLNELPNPICDADLRAAFNAQYGRDFGNVNTHKLADLGCRRSKNQVWYVASEKVSLISKVEKFVDTQTGPFTLNEAKEALGNICLYYGDDTLRSYITNFCRVNNKEDSLFCPVELVEENSQDEWRKKSDQDQTHYYLTTLISLLSDNGDSMTLEDCVKQLKEQGGSEGYNTRNVKSIVQKYADPEKDESFLELNQGVVALKRDSLDRMDLKTIGRKGIYLGEVMPIISFTSKILNDQPSIALTELGTLINENINPNISRTSIQRLIIKYGDDIEVKKLDGTLTVCYKENHRFQPEPKYEIEVSADEPCVTASVESKPRIEISSIIDIDWELLQTIVVKELAYHVRTNRFGANFNLQNAVSSYFDFIRSSQNRLLCERIPRGIYRYYLGATDWYDRYGFLNDMILGFEGMLRDFLPRNGITTQRVVGLRELIYAHYYDNIYVMSAVDENYEGSMSRTLNDLISKRNKLAHGQYIELSSSKMALTLIDYLALSIYVFNIISAHAI